MEGLSYCQFNRLLSFGALSLFIEVKRDFNVLLIGLSTIFVGITNSLKMLNVGKHGFHAQDFQMKNLSKIMKFTAAAVVVFAKCNESCFQLGWLFVELVPTPFEWQKHWKAVKIHELCMVC